MVDPSPRLHPIIVTGYRQRTATKMNANTRAGHETYTKSGLFELSTISTLICYPDCGQPVTAHRTRGGMVDRSEAPEYSFPPRSPYRALELAHQQFDWGGACKHSRRVNQPSTSNILGLRYVAIVKYRFRFQEMHFRLVNPRYLVESTVRNAERCMHHVLPP